MTARAKVGTPATVLLERAKVAFTVHTYTPDPRATSYGIEAAESLGFPSAQVFKTLLVTDGKNHYVGIVPVTGSLDLKAMAKAVGVSKVTMLDPAVAQRITGYVVGGISPLGQRKALPTILDSSAAAWGTILVSAGRRGADLELSPADLLELASGKFDQIART